MSEFQLEDCVRCDGKGYVIQPYYGEPMRLARHYGNGAYEVFVDQAHSPKKCGMCKGFLYVNKHGDSYKSQAIADRYIASGKARRCTHCDDNGMSWIVPAEQRCLACSDCGKQPVYDSASTIMPEMLDLTDYFPNGFLAEYVKDAVVIIDRQGGVLTVGESLLGLGTVWSSSDYGRTWEMNDDDIVKMIKNDIAEGHHQMIKLVDKKSRKLSRLIGIRLTRSGYGVYALEKEPDGYALPPTYYPLIDQPSTILER